MRWLGLALTLLAACATKHVDIGATCTKADECGNGADCYHRVCTPMCTSDDECRGDLVCAHHRCLTATGEPRANTDQLTDTGDDEPLRPGMRGPAKGIVPPPGGAPADVMTELRAIKAELEAIRAEQKRLADALEASHDSHRQ